MNPHIDKINQSIAPQKALIVKHPLYAQIQNLEHVRIFMQNHVYAVWDFMSLLKSLQQNLTCTTTPWLPKGSAETRFLINEIVVGEESDVDMNGIRKSHFEMYLDAMEQAGADNTMILGLTEEIRNGKPVEAALEQMNLPTSVKEFVQFTFRQIAENKPHVLSAIFTFGREDLIPDMFMALVNDLNLRFPEKIAPFKYYLDRHIEVDGDHHSHLALQMTAELCGTDEKKWEEATQASMEALRLRNNLWTGVLEEIMPISAALS
ncbi:MAG: DUF3050 domain-containing protein [Sphingomonadales bacterium]|nr:DUF3050 domain-containing protein [Sphingomonadales bacterium]